MARLAREKRTKEVRERKEQQAKEAKEKREAELKSRQEAQARAVVSSTFSSSIASSPAGGGTGGVGGGLASASATASLFPARCASLGSSGNGVHGSSTGSSHGGVLLRPSGASTRQVGIVGPVGAARADFSRDVGRRPNSLTQRAAVHVTGLSPRIAKEEILRRHEYFGQYGKIVRVAVSPAAVSSANGPISLRACITFTTNEEAEQAVLAVDNVVLDGRTLKAHIGSSVKLQGDDDISHERDDGDREKYREEGEGARVDTNDSVGAPQNVNEVAACASANLAVAQVSGSQGASAVGMHDRTGNRREPGHWQSSTCACGGVGPPVVGASNVGCGAINGPAHHACSSQDVLSIEGDLAFVRAKHAIDTSSSLGNTLRETSGARSTEASMSATSSHDAPAILNPRGSTVAPDGGGAVGELEPWSGLGSFEDLLNGLVSEEEEESLPGSSRFARFFSSASLDDVSCTAHGTSSSESSTLASLGGHKLDAQFTPSLDMDGHVCGNATSDEWQKQGFRALLPNVNISFTPFGASPEATSSAVGDAAANGGRALGTVGTPAKSHSVSGDCSLHGLSGFSNLGATATVGGPTRAVLAAANSGTIATSAPLMPVGVGSSSSSGSMTAGSLAGAFDIAGGLSTSITSSAANGASGSLPGIGGIGGGEMSKNATASSAVPSLLGQLSASSIPLPGAQLPACGLSSSLQSLLQSSNASCGNPIVGGTSSGVVGRGGTSGAERVHDPSTSTGARWHSCSRGNDSAGGLVPGWLAGDSLQAKAANDDASGERVDGVGQKDVGSNGPSRGSGSGASGDRGGGDRSGNSKKEGGSSDRGGKGKKRGGANNRGKGSNGGDTKLTHK